MNFEDRETVDRDWDENQLYKKIEAEILKNKYSLSWRSKKWVTYFAARSQRPEYEVVASILEKFNQEQGGLPGELSGKYVEAVFSTDSIRKQMDGRLNFNEAVAALAVAVKRKGIFLDEGTIDKAVKVARLELVDAEAGLGEK